METMYAAGRRNLPPVPRPAPDRLVRQEPGPVPRPRSAEAAPAPAAADRTPGVVPREQPDVGQQFVVRLRSAAPAFAAAAGAQSAVVREAVPPARHRRARCRLVLRSAEGNEVDLTFLGPAGRPGAATARGFEESIQRWLGDGQRREPAWLVPDDDAAEGAAVDVPAWLAAR
jgi:hypothetical protein